MEITLNAKLVANLGESVVLEFPGIEPASLTGKLRVYSEGRERELTKIEERDVSDLFDDFIRKSVSRAIAEFVNL